MYQIDMTCNNNSEFVNTMESCNDQTSCTISHSKSWFVDFCEFDPTGKKLYLKIYCKGVVVNVFGKDFTKEQFSWVIFVANFLTVVTFIFFLLN